MGFFIKQDSQEDNGLRAVGLIMFTGAVFVIIVSIWSGYKFFSVLGLSALIGLAAMLAGGFLGFLFGIPRSLQHDNTTSAGAAALKYGSNTNLEQISDWLTKIIVGVSLTQLPAIEHRLHLLTKSVSAGFDGALASALAYPYSASIMIFYAICGFMLVYLYASFYLLQQFNKLGSMGVVALNDKLDIVVTKMDAQATLLQISQLESKVEEFDTEVKTIRACESKEAFKDVIEKASPGPIKYLNDSQKGRWGGSATSDMYQIDASFSKQESSWGFDYKVIIYIKAKGTAQLQGVVYFFMHDSYNPDCIMEATASENMASVTFPAYAASTVGLYIPSSNTKLEFDMNLYENIPQDFKYSETLQTIDEVKAAIDALKKML